MNVYEFAMKMEIDGKNYYSEMAAKVTHPGLRSIFMRLAKDEQKHFETFAAMNDGKSPVMAASPLLDATTNVFEDLPKEPEKVSAEMGDLEAYQHAMQLESDSFKFYEEAASKETREEAKELLLKIAGEEHKHFNILANLYQFANAPNQYLAWREFSNLEDFHQFGRDVDG